MKVLARGSAITVQDNLTILSPSYPTDTAIIFYPGAKVEAYLPLLNQVRQLGVTCILVHMPFQMAIFDANAAEEWMPFLHKGIHNRKRGAYGRSAFHSSLCRYTISTSCTPPS